MMNPLATPASRRTRRRLMTGGAVGLAISALMLAPQARAQVSPPAGTAFQGTPQVVSGGASIVQTPTVDTIRVTTPQAVINWTPNDRIGTGTIDFLPNGLRGQFIGGADFTVLNRIIPLNGQDVPVARMVALNGMITSQIGNPAAGTQTPGGSVWFYSPGGILVGSSAVINVGSLLLTTRDIDTTGGLFGSTGEIRFRNPSIAGALGAVQIAPGAQINARAAVTGSSYIAVVAPSIVQAGTVRADGSVALIAAEQADIRINQGLFEINVLVGTDDAHGIIHTGTTGGPSDNSGSYESRAYLVAVPKNQAITMLLSGTIGFETASSVSIASNGGIILSAGHNIVGGIAGPRVPGSGAGNISITDSSFRNNLDATASGAITARPSQSCQPLCSATGPNGQLLVNGNATFNGATGVSLSIGQAQRIIVSGNLSLLSGTPGQGGSASLTIDNVSPPSSSSGSGIVSITGALLIDASARGNPAGSGAAIGGTAALSVNNGFLNAASISVQADALGVLGGSTTGGSGTGGTARLTVENGGSVSTSGFLRVSADGRGGGIGIDAQQNPLLPTIGGTGRGGSATAIVDNALLSANSASVSASGFGAAGTTTSGDGFGGTAGVSVDNDGGTTSLTGSSLLVQARGEGGGSGFDPVTFQSISTADGGNGIGGTASLALTDTTPRDVNLGFVVVDAGASGGVAQSSSQTPVLAAGGDAQGGTASFTMAGTTSAATIEQLTVSSVAQGGSGIGTLGRGGNARGGTSNLSLSSGATLTNSNSQSTFGGSRLNADGFGGIGQDRSGNGIGGASNALVAAGARIDTDIIFLTASGIGGGGELAQQSFTPVTTIGGNGSGGTVTLTSGGTINSASIELDANGFGGNSNPGSGAVSVSTGGNAVGGTARINQTGGAIGVAGATIRANATAGGSATPAGSSGSSLGGGALLFQTGGTFTVTGNLSVEARGYVVSGFGNQRTQTGGSAGIAVSTGTFDVDGAVNLDASAGSTNITSDTTESLAVTGGSTSFDATNGAIVTAGSLLLTSSANGGFNFGSEKSGAGASATGGTGKLRSASGAQITVDNLLRIDAVGLGGFAARGGSGTGGTIELGIDGGTLTLSGPAQLNAGGVSGFSFGTSGSTSATGGSVSITVGGAGSAFKFADLAATANADAGQPVSPAARGGPAPVVASNAVGGIVAMTIDGGSVTGNQLSISADAFGSAGGSGTGGSARFDQTGGTAQFIGIGLSADGFGGTSAPGIETGSGPVVGGAGRGGTAGVALVGGSITTSFFSVSASGTGGRGFTPVAVSGNGGSRQLFSGDGGDGYGGVIDVLIDGTASVNLQSAIFEARGFGGNGGDYRSDGVLPSHTPGRGGGGFGGDVFVDLAGGDLVGTALFALAGGRGGDGGRIFTSNGPNGEGGFAGSPDDLQPIGGNAQGGIATIRPAAEYTSTTLSADATAGAGEGGTAMAGARGGNARGGFASILIDGVDAGSIDISISAEGYGGRGGRPLHGEGGDGGDGTGGIARVEITNDGTASLSDIDVSTSGFGGGGRRGEVNGQSPAVATGFAGGDGGQGFGGTIEVAVTDADLTLSAGNAESVIIESFGFGGLGGDGAANISGSPTVATFGGRGGNGGNGVGGGITLAASGGTLTTDDGESIRLVATGTSGLGGNGGLGNAVTTVNPLTGVSTTQGGSGFSGFTGLEFGGLVRIEAHDTPGGAGLVDLPSAIIDVSGQLGGRVELIDDTAGPGIAFGVLTISTAGGSVIGSDFAAGGSGVYISSRNAPITANGLSLSIDGNFQVDAFDTGGLAVSGAAVLSTTLDIVANHSGRASNSTISAEQLTFNARSILFQPGTLVTSTLGNITLNAIDNIAFAKLSATSGSIFLVAGRDISGDEAIAGGNIEGDAGGDINVTRLATAGIGGGQTSSAPSSGIVRLAADDTIAFETINARGGVNLTAGTNIDGDDIDTGGDIFATSAEGNIDIDTSSASGSIAFTAAEGNVIGDFAESRFGNITIRASSVDFGELYAAGNIDIAADEDVTLDYAETGGEGGSHKFQRPLGKNLLAGTNCEDCISASDGDILIVAGDNVALGTLDALDDIVITAGTLTGSTSSLTAGDALTATIEGNAAFGSLLSGGNMALTAGGTATGQSAETKGAGSSLALSATNGLTMGTVRAAGTAGLTASAGAVSVANLRSVGLVDASGRSVTVSGGTGLIDFQSLRATAGDARVTVGNGDLVVRSGTATGTLALTTQNGAIETRGVQGGTVTIDSSRGATINNAATATGTLGITARNSATINGVASGGSVRITSGDIVIASGARVGTGGTTTDVLLINGDGTRRTFVGGTGSTAGYSLSADEMTRLFGNNITIRAPRVSISGGLVASAPGTSIIAPSGEPDLVIDAFSLNGGGSATGNLGSSGILRIETPGFARVIGAAQVTNATPNNSFVVAADRSLQVILGSGSLRINGGSGLVGALRLISEDIVVATASAIADIAVAPDMAAIDDRLASNDGVLSEEGALSGGTIRFEVGRGLYIQNSGNGDGFDDRRGFTAGTGGVGIFTGESSSTAGGGTARLVINGRTTSEAGEILTGIDAFTRISVNQTLLTGDSQIVNGLDTGSTINGCLIVSASNCFDFEIDLIPPIQDNPLVDFDDEESRQTDGSDPLNLTSIVEIEDVDRMSNEPIVDEPVTGSGNDDLWVPSEDEEEDD